MESRTSFKTGATKKYSPNDEKQYLDWVGSVDATLGLLRSRPRNSSTYRVPSRLRAVKDEAYTPQMVSIGPFHRTKPELQGMEEVKWSYMLAYVDRVAKSDLENNKISTLDGESGDSTLQRMALLKCSKIVSELEEEARAWYAEDIHLDKYQLMEMLLVDACFILELLYRQKLVSRERTGRFRIPVEDGLPFESLAGNLIMLETLTHDLLLLENQIPYVILRKLFEIIPNPKTAEHADKFLQPSIYSFFGNHGTMLLLCINIKCSEEERYGKHRKDEDGTYIHLLDVLYHACNFPDQNLPSSRLLYWERPKCATELLKSGIKFIPDYHKTIVDISFREGKIYIPPVFTDESSDTIYRNLIAYEQTSVGRSAITSYVTLMSSLIRSPEDAYILKRARILDNDLDDVSGFFGSLYTDVVLSKFCYRDLYAEINNYQISPWEWRRVNGYFIVTWYRWKESINDLKRDYFRNRWSIIVSFAATLALVLAALQTFYTIRAYYPK